MKSKLLPPITIVDYGMGNIGSLINMFRKIGVKIDISSKPDEISRANKILLPGVGAFDSAMNKIDELGLRKVLYERAMIAKIPFLGICLGMQLLVESSEEGNKKGLGFINGSAKRFPVNEKLKVPHMGWNTIKITQNNKLTQFLPEDPRFYFVHSYYVKVSHRSNSIMSCEYGINFDAGISNGNIFGAQFHPEKSHKYGLSMLKNFVEMPCYELV